MCYKFRTYIRLDLLIIQIRQRLVFPRLSLLKLVEHFFILHKNMANRTKWFIRVTSVLTKPLPEKFLTKRVRQCSFFRIHINSAGNDFAYFGRD